MKTQELVNQSKGLELCKILYKELNIIGVFPALTGGLLYKEGNRKDIDIVLYRHRQELDGFETKEIELILSRCGLTDFQYFGFVTKAKWQGVTVDLFNPETKSDDKENRYGDYS